MIGDNQSPAIGAATQFQPGQSGNPAGRPLGSKNLGMIIRELMINPPDWDKVNIKGVQRLKERFKNASAGEALVYVALTKAMTGDVTAMRWLSRTGYGDKVTFEGDVHHDGVVIYKPEKYPRQDETPQQPVAPGAQQKVAPLSAPDPDLEGIA